MHGGGKQRFHTRAVFFLLVSMMVFTPLGPLAEVMVSEAEAAAGTRHVYEFSDGSVEHIALYQGANPDMGACLLYTSPSPRDGLLSRMPSSA